MLADVGWINIDSDARAGWHLDFPIDYFERRCFALELNIRFQAFELMMRHGIGKSRNKMHHIKESESASGHVGSATFPEGLGHSRHFHGADHSSEVIIIRLDNLHGV